MGSSMPIGVVGLKKSGHIFLVKSYFCLSEIQKFSNNLNISNKFLVGKEKSGLQWDLNPGL